MAREGRDPDNRFTEDLVGLDPEDPEVRAFARHRDRIEHPNCHPTVEGTLRGVEDFAECANRTEGHRRVKVVLVVTLILVSVAAAGWNALVFACSTLLL